jgi:alpha-ketoglutarate-dependent taurine dioxygenase
VISGERERLSTTQTVSERGVVFFRNQNDLTFEDQKNLGQKLGELTGKPETSKVGFSSQKHGPNAYCSI